jgi:hypothetical protein
MTCSAQHAAVSSKPPRAFHHHAHSRTVSLGNGHFLALGRLLTKEQPAVLSPPPVSSRHCSIHICAAHSTDCTSRHQRELSTSQSELTCSVPRVLLCCKSRGCICIKEVSPDIHESGHSFITQHNTKHAHLLSTAALLVTSAYCQLSIMTQLLSTCTCAVQSIKCHQRLLTRSVLRVLLC